MATFYYFNIQALPNSEDKEFIGTEGYKKLFTLLAKKTAKYMKEKTIGNIAVPLRNDYFFSPVKIEIRENYAQGFFRKFDQVTSLKEFYTNSDIDFAGESGLITSKAFNFHFVFDFDKHILAISDYDNRLPSTSILEDSFTNLISLCLDEISDDHYIECITLKDGTKLHTLLDATKFKSIQSSITFSNPIDVEDFLEENVLEEELRHHGVSKLTTNFASSSKGYMSGLPKIARAILKLSTKFGDATGRYWDETTEKFQTFALHNFPIKIPISKRKNSSDEAYFKEISDTIADADSKTKS
jgi:hypothetical protein